MSPFQVIRTREKNASRYLFGEKNKNVISTHREPEKIIGQLVHHENIRRVLKYADMKANKQNEKPQFNNKRGNSDSPFPKKTLVGQAKISAE